MRGFKMSYVGNTQSNRSAIKLLFCIAFLIYLAFPSQVLAKVKQDSTVPPVGLEWIKVKIPLKYSYHSTAISRHKNIISDKSEIENLSDYPVEVDLSGFVSDDGKSSPKVSGIDNLFIDVGEQKINLVTNGKPDVFNNGDKLTKLYTLGGSSGSSIHGNFKGSSKGNISFSGNTQGGVNSKRVIFQDNSLNFIFKALDGDGNIPKDQTTIKIKNSKISIGTKWEAKDNYIGGKDEYGNPLDFSKVTTGGDKVDTNKAGEYKITYSYRNTTETAVVSVIPELTFMNEKWNIIKSPEQLGAGNYLIAGQQSLGSSLFASRKEYYSDDNDSLDGYQDNTLIKPIIDQWYDNNIKGTIYENYIEPVVLSNPTLGDMKKLGWASNTSADSGTALKAINQPNAYPTKIDIEKGEKQAFVMSGSDISNGQGKYGDLSDNGVLYRDFLTSKGYQKFWLRTPGQHDDWTGIVRSDKTSLWDDYLSNSHEVMPSLIIHTGIPVIHVQSSVIYLNSLWKPEDNFVDATDEYGNNIPMNKVDIAGDKVDTSRVGKYNVTYSYGGITQVATINVKDGTTIQVKNSDINVGTSWKPIDNFVSGTNELGNDLDISNISVGGDKVNPLIPGTYNVTYSYKEITKTATIKVLEKITFMDQQWDIIKTPDKLGSGNYLISMEHSIKALGFKPSGTQTYYSSNSDASNGYIESSAKPIVDNWYDNNIKGKIYENFVQPVVLLTPTLGDMKKLGWISYTNAGDKGNEAFVSISKPNAYPTKIDTSSGIKQAFLMSSSDVSNDNDIDKVTYTDSAIAHRNELKRNGVDNSWLRNVGTNRGTVAVIGGNTNIMNPRGIGFDFGVVPSLIIHLGDMKPVIKVHDSTIACAQDWKPEDNFNEGMDEFANTLSFDKIVVGGDKVDTSKEGIYHVSYSYGGVTETASIKVKNESAIKVKNSEIDMSTAWQPKDNFDGGTDESGNPLDFSKVTIGGDTVDTNKAGEYKVTYSYRNITGTATISVIPELTFMNQKWDVIKGPEELGTGNYLIAMEKSIGTSSFNKSSYYYSTNADSSDGYQQSEIKKVVDTWYDNNIKGTPFENFVQPVILSNPTLGDMKKFDWSSNDNGHSRKGFLAINQPNAYPTLINDVKGAKQAFAMSGSDVSNGKGEYGDLTPNVLFHMKKLKNNGIDSFWLRSPGEYYNLAERLTNSKDEVWDNNIEREESVVPSLVIHTGDPTLHIKNSEVSLNSVWKMQDAR